MQASSSKDCGHVFLLLSVDLILFATVTFAMTFQSPSDHASQTSCSGAELGFACNFNGCDQHFATSQDGFCKVKLSDLLSTTIVILVGCEYRTSCHRAMWNGKLAGGCRRCLQERLLVGHLFDFQIATKLPMLRA
jgi:hypothetical protein